MSSKRSQTQRKCILFLILIAVGSTAWYLSKRQLYHAEVPYLETPPEIVELMLDLAGVDADSIVYDLGSGDGRITIAAALRGAKSKGVEIDRNLVELSRKKARENLVDGRAEFIHSSLFEVDLSEANVVTLYLSPRINRELRPKLLGELKPGTRIVSHIFDMEDWEPARVIEASGRRLFLWVIPENETRRPSPNLERRPLHWGEGV